MTKLSLFLLALLALAMKLGYVTVDMAANCLIAFIIVAIAVDGVINAITWVRNNRWESERSQLLISQFDEMLAPARAISARSRKSYQSDYPFEAQPQAA